MFGWFKKKPRPPASNEAIAVATPGVIFPWAKGWQFTALDETILAVPAAIIGQDEVIGSIIHTDDNLRLSLPTPSTPTPGDRITFWLEAGQSVWLSKSCQGVVVPRFEGDTAPRRFRIFEVEKDDQAKWRVDTIET